MSRVIKPSLGELLDTRYRQHPRYRGCVGHWMAVEGGGTTLYDFSGWQNHGTFSGSPIWGLGPCGSALNINGAGYVNCGNSASLNVSSFTIALRAYYNSGSFGTWQSICGRQGFTSGNIDYICDMNSSGLIRAGVAGVTASSGATVPFRQWFSFVFSHSPSGFNCYLNAQLTGSGAAIGTPTTSYNFIIGDHWDNPWNGLFDYVRLYNRALTPSEVLSLYQDPFLEFEDEESVFYSIPGSQFLYSQLERAGRGMFRGMGIGAR